MSATESIVSVVTPCLNPGDRLRRCLASVLAQDYPRIEHIVVDGGSTDGTLDVLGASSARWVSEPDSGQSSALNKGFRLAEGEIIGWLNADDVLHPFAVSAVVAALSTTPEAGWAYGDCEIVAADRSNHIRRPGAVTGSESFFDTNPIAQPGVFLTRAAMQQVGGVDESLRLALDFDLWLRLVDAGFRGVYVPLTLASFEITKDSKTGSSGWSEFLREEALALAKSGRPREASLKLGAAAAFAAESASGSVDRRQLGREVRAARAWATSRGLTVHPSQVRAGAALSASRLGRSPKRLLHLLRPELWVTGRTREEMVARVARRLPLAGAPETRRR